MSNATDLRHAPWCDVEEHAQAAEEDPGRTVGCVGRPIEVGPVGGWLTNNDSDDGSTRIAVDWKPADWQSLTPQEVAELAGFCALVLVEHATGSSG